MSWNELTLNPSRLSADLFNQVYENMEYIQDALDDLGVEHEDIVFVTATRDVPIIEVRDKLQGIEDDLTILNDVAESLYFNGSKTIMTVFTADDYNRWVNILNDLYGIVVENLGVWNVARLTAETDSPIPTDKYGNVICIRGEQLG